MKYNFINKDGLIILGQVLFKYEGTKKTSLSPRKLREFIILLLWVQISPPCRFLTLSKLLDPKFFGNVKI